VERAQSEQNKDIVLEAFDTLFNKRDYATAEKLWSEDYVQHSSRIPPGRDGLFDVIKSRPPEFAYEPELIMAENDLVMLWGRFTGHGAGPPWIVVNIIRVERGLLKEHWDVIEDEVTLANSLSGLPMFGDTFPEERSGCG
jgi:predicted SnoaL-like aldol condensation-catalyzing enzyme